MTIFVQWRCNRLQFYRFYGMYLSAGRPELKENLSPQAEKALFNRMLSMGRKYGMVL
jgi:hypothetical protein